jgi:thymidylate synthase
LREDSDTRQAVMTIWTPNPGPTKDVPCTVAFQFLLRGGALNMIATMRSSDAWLGFPYDLFNFSQLLNWVAGQIGVEVGWIQMDLGSSHLYQRNFMASREVVLNAGSTVTSPPLPVGPPPPIVADALMNQWHPDDDPVQCHPAWFPYACALRARTSELALGCLR